jgi:Fic family protein
MKQAIWNASTGIMGISETDLNAPDLTSALVREFSALRETHAQNPKYTHFLEALKREWAIETGVIEGVYTLDKGTTTTLIEHGFVESYISQTASDMPAPLLIDILKDHEGALEMVYDLVKNNRHISTSFIKELHSCLMKNQHEIFAKTQEGKTLKVPLLKGQWKIHPNNPERVGINFGYCPPEQTASEMDKLIKLLHEYETQNVPACLLAAWFHHAFTQIHPFQDGNGRVVRALASAILIRAGLFPLSVTRGEMRKDYIDALEAADKGNINPFAGFITRLQRNLLLKAQIASEEAIKEAFEAGLQTKLEKENEIKQLLKEVCKEKLVLFEKKLTKYFERTEIKAYDFERRFNLLGSAEEGFVTGFSFKNNFNFSFYLKSIYEYEAFIYNTFSYHSEDDIDLTTQRFALWCENQLNSVIDFLHKT